MDRVGLGFLGDPDHLFDREIGIEGPFADADLIGFVRLEAVQRKLVLFGKDRKCSNSKFGCRTEHANRNFRAIGDE
jgi:hypothetical protein